MRFPLLLSFLVAGLGYKLVVVGGGIGGSHVAFRAGQKLKRGDVALFEATNSACGIAGDFELQGSTAEHPLRIGGCALRVNKGTMVPMRNLANELGIPLYYTGFKSEWQLLGRQGARSADPAVRAGWELPALPFANVDDTDPEVEALLFMMGSAKGNGFDRNPITGDENPANHPTQRCRDFPDIYSMFRHYLGDTYANFVCNANVGFYGDCFGSNEPCAYLDWYQREWNTQDNGYPTGGYSELCRRMRANGTANGVDYFYSEAVTKIENRPPGKYTITTNKRVVVADEVVLSVPPSALSLIEGDVVAAIQAQPQAKAPKPVESITVAARFPTAWWRGTDGLITPGDITAYRLLQSGGGCLTRLEIHNSPYVTLHNTIRVVYTDYNCKETWRSAIEQGQATLKSEIMRSLQKAFPERTIPEPTEIFSEIQPNAWFWLRPGTPFTVTALAEWAKAPLGADKRVCLAQQAFRIADSGWGVSAVRLGGECLNRFYPAEFPASRLQDWETAYGRIEPGWAGEIEADSPLANEFMVWNDTDPVVWSTLPQQNGTNGPAPKPKPGDPPRSDGKEKKKAKQEKGSGGGKQSGKQGKTGVAVGAAVGGGVGLALLGGLLVVRRRLARNDTQSKKTDQRATVQV